MKNKLLTIILILKFTFSFSQKENSKIHVKGGEFNCRQNEKFKFTNIKVKSFYIDKFEVTNRDFEKFTKATGYITYAEKLHIVRRNNPDNKSSRLVDAENWRSFNKVKNNYKNYLDHPVIYVSYRDAEAYCKWKGGRLPKRYEWLFAATGGNKSKKTIYSGSNNPDNVAWTSKNSEKRVHIVGSKQCNELGIHDMSGNVVEICGDIIYLESDSYFFIEGGYFNLPPEPIISKYTQPIPLAHLDLNYNHLGFRCAYDNE